MFTCIGSATASSEFPDNFANQVYFSEGTSFEGYSYKSVYSIKYVISGYEKYRVGNHCFKIKPGQILTVNNGSEINCLPSDSKAISIFLEPSLINDVYRNLTMSDDNLLVDPFDSKGEHEPHFWEDVYDAKETGFSELTQYLSNISPTNNKSKTTNEKEIFYQLSEKLIRSQQKSLNELSLLDSVKYSTRSELYRRLLIGKEYLHSNWNSPLSLKKVASVSTLSQFHFHRLFLQTFRQTPFQYHRRLRVEKALYLLKNKTCELMEVAELLGFSDYSTFSKFIKNNTRMSPGQIASTSQRHKA